MNIFEKDFTEAASKVYAENNKFGYVPSKLEVTQELWLSELDWNERALYVGSSSVGSGAKIGVRLLSCYEKLMEQVNWPEAFKAGMAQ